MRERSLSIGVAPGTVLALLAACAPAPSTSPGSQAQSADRPAARKRVVATVPRPPTTLNLMIAGATALQSWNAHQWHVS